MQLVKHGFLYAIGTLSFVLTTVAFGKLTWFLSAPLKQSTDGQKLNIDAVVASKKALNVLFVNSALTVGFVLIHSFAKADWFKKLCSGFGLTVAHRSISNIFSGLFILVSGVT